MAVGVWDYLFKYFQLLIVDNIGNNSKYSGKLYLTLTLVCITILSY
jgi:hypothetical protein